MCCVGAAVCGFSGVAGGEGVSLPLPELCKSGGCTSSAWLQPRRRDLHANKKKKGEGPGRAGAPAPGGRAPPAALRREGVSWGWEGGSEATPGSTPPPLAPHTPSSSHSTERSEFTSFVWMLSAPPPPTPTLATLTLTPARAQAAGLRGARTPPAALALEPRQRDGCPPRAPGTHQ